MRKYWLLLLLVVCSTAHAADLLISDDFETGDVSASWDEVNWNNNFYTPTTSATKFVSSSPAPHGGSYALHGFLPDGAASESTAFDLRLFPSGVTQPHYDFWIYVKSGYDYGTWQKIARAGAFDVAGGEVEFNLTQDEGQLQLQVLCYGNACCDVDRGFWTGEYLPTDQWVHVVWSSKLNTPGSSDGYTKLWINDELVEDQSNIDVRGSCTDSLNTMWIGGPHSTALTADSSRYFDDIKLYDGVPEATPTPTPDPQVGTIRRNSVRGFLR